MLRPLHPHVDAADALGKKVARFFVKAVKLFMFGLVCVAAGYFWAVAAYGVLK